MTRMTDAFVIDAFLYGSNRKIIFTVAEITIFNRAQYKTRYLTLLNDGSLTERLGLLFYIYERDCGIFTLYLQRRAMSINERSNVLKNRRWKKKQRLFGEKQ